MTRADLLIIGAGPAGLAAAIAARQAGVKDLLVLEREEASGGILRQCIHNGFGLHRFKEELTGPEYAQRDIDLAADLGIRIQTNAMALSVTRDKVVSFVSRQEGPRQIECGAIILCTGCRERSRGAIGTPGTRCAGVFSAGTAQKFVNLHGFMPGSQVVILGSGDIGLIMARRMTLQGARVLACVEIMPYSSGLNRNIVQCLNDYDIPLYLSHTVTDIRGTSRLNGITISRVDENRRPVPGTEIDFSCDTLLLSVGLIPENELALGAGLNLSAATGGVLVDDRFETEIDGVFSAGNALHVHDLADDVSEEAARAGRAAADYLLRGGQKRQMLSVMDGRGVLGAVPQKIAVPAEEDVRVRFRVDRVYENAYVCAHAQGAVFPRRKHRILTPGEMAQAVLPKQPLSLAEGDIVISIEGEKER
ncbi:MAG: NAD(P)/FAD-dependent oxidoreductase [Clostridia bacterium]|nr:NAD(P)/FAD-dependent oxidoreductase [Clostridia bacterium]